MTAPTRLVYFNISGLGEPVRFMLAYCGEHFIDERISMDEFKQRKDTFPFGKVPYLEIDGLYLHQTMSICRYLARKHGFTGNTDVEATQADVMADTVNDVRAGLVNYFDEQDPVIKEKKLETALKNTAYYLNRLEKIVQNNGGYLVKNQITWADVVFASLSSFMNHMAQTDLFESRPALRDLKNKVLALPSIKKYLDNRPQHAF